MANIITTLGHDPIAMKRATETALAQISNELDKITNGIASIQTKLAELEARIAALEP